MVGPRRSAAPHVDPGHSAAGAPPQSGNGDASDAGQVSERGTSQGAIHKNPNGAQPGGRAKPEQTQPSPPHQVNPPTHDDRPVPARLRAASSVGMPTSRIKVLGCKVENPHCMRRTEITRIVVLYWALRMPLVLLAAAVMYSHNLKMLKTYASKLQLNSEELVTVAVCVAIFIVLAIALKIPHWQQHDDRLRDESGDDLTDTEE
jgi:hypothetical protein